MRKLIYLLAASVWLWAACAGVATPNGEPNVTGPGPTSAPAAEPTNPPAAGPTNAPAAEPTNALAVAPTATREIKTDFVATDPSTVQLAAGKPQLVEFFAVW